MKTDRFDEEFRRKLHGLPDESGPGDVSRIHGYVTRHLPPVPGLGWGGLAGYVAGGLVLLGSLLYNGVQYQKTTALQTTVDSLRTTPPALAQQPAPAAPPLVRTDTVYITRYPNAVDDAPTALKKQMTRNGEQLVQATPEAAHNRLDNPVLANPNQPVRQADRPESGTANDRRLSQSLPTNNPDNDLTSAQKEAGAIPKTVSDSAVVTAAISVEKADKVVRSASERPEISAEPNVVNPVRNPIMIRKSVPNRPDVSRAKTRQKTKVNGSVNNVSAREQTGTIATINQTPDDNKAPNPAGDRLTESGQSRTYVVKERTEQAEVVVSLLKNRDLPTKNLSVTILRKPVYQPVAVEKVMPVRRPFRLNLPTIALPKPQYFGGVDFMGGDEHLGGSLLGEVRLNPRWSVQTGVRLMAMTGFDYHSDDDFRKEEDGDFRALYAPNVAPGTGIRDIHQLYALAQIPLTVAYHYPLGRAWGLRLGVGTGFDVLVHSRIRFDVDRNGRDSDHGLQESNVPVSLFNNVTVSAGVERQWKRLLFRASPYISPQLKRVSYKDDAFYWGGQVQVLWQFK